MVKKESLLIKEIIRGMIDEKDLDIITLTDDLDCVVSEIDISLSKQIQILEDADLKQTSYYKSLSSLRK